MTTVTSEVENKKLVDDKPLVYDLTYEALEKWALSIGETKFKIGRAHV